MVDRLMNDLTPQTTPAEDAADVSSVLASNAQNQDPFDPMAQLDVLRLKSDIVAYEASLVTRVNAYIERMEEVRDSLSGCDGLMSMGSFRARYIREWERYSNRQYPAVDGLGQIDMRKKDAHLHAGVNAGMYGSMCDALSSRIMNALFNPSRRFAKLTPNGKKAENAKKTKIGEELSEMFIDKSNMTSMGEMFCHDLVCHGIGTARQIWITRKEWVRGKDGRFLERLVERGSRVEYWNPLDVYFSNPERNHADFQDVVVWRSQTSLGSLECEECTSTIVEAPMTGATGEIEKISRPVRSGRFINLDFFKNKNASDPGTTSARVTSGDNGYGTPRVAIRVPLFLFEAQGYLSIGSDLRSGALKFTMFDHYGLWDFVPEHLQQPALAGDPSAIEQIARIFDRVMWYVTTAKEEIGGATAVVEFHPCPYSRQRNELISAWFIHGTGMYGLSVESVVGNMIDVADGLLNNIVKIIQYNSKGKRVVNTGLLAVAGGDSKEAVSKVCGEGNDDLVMVRTATGDVDKAVKFLSLPYDSSFVQLFQMVQMIINKRAMSSELDQGGQAQTETNTASEAATQIDGLSRKLTMIISRISTDHVVAPIVRNALDDAESMLTDDELNKLVMEISGETALDWKAIHPTPADDDAGAMSSRFSDDFTIESTFFEENDKSIKMQFLMNADAAFKDLPEFDRVENAKNFFDAAGVDSSDTIHAQNSVLSPAKMFEMIVASGDRPDVSRVDDPQQYLQEFMARVPELVQQRQEYIDQDLPADAIDGQLATVASVVSELQDMIVAQKKKMMQMLQQMQLEAGGQPQNQPLPGEGQGQQKGQNKAPASNQAVKNDVLRGTKNTRPTTWKGPRQS